MIVFALVLSLWENNYQTRKVAFTESILHLKPMEAFIITQTVIADLCYNK